MPQWSTEINNTVVLMKLLADTGCLGEIIVNKINWRKNILVPSFLSAC